MYFATLGDFKHLKRLSEDVITLHIYGAYVHADSLDGHAGLPGDPWEDTARELLKRRFEKGRKNIEGNKIYFDSSVGGVYRYVGTVDEILGDNPRLSWDVSKIRESRGLTFQEFLKEVEPPQIWKWEPDERHEKDLYLYISGTQQDFRSPVGYPYAITVLGTFIYANMFVKDVTEDFVIQDLIRRSAFVDALKLQEFNGGRYFLLHNIPPKLSWDVSKLKPKHKDVCHFCYTLDGVKRTPKYYLPVKTEDAELDRYQPVNDSFRRLLGFLIYLCPSHNDSYHDGVSKAYRDDLIVRVDSGVCDTCQSWGDGEPNPAVIQMFIDDPQEENDLPWHLCKSHLDAYQFGLVNKSTQTIKMT